MVFQTLVLYDPEQILLQLDTFLQQRQKLLKLQKHKPKSYFKKIE